MSQTQRSPQGIIKSVPIWGAIKEGFLFPFALDKDKACTFVIHLILITLLFVAPSLLFPFVKVGQESYLGAIPLVIGALTQLFMAGVILLSRVYTSQRIVLGQAVRPYLVLWCTPYFKRYALFSLFYFALLILYEGAQKALMGPIALLMFVPSCYLFARLRPIFPDLATHDPTRMGRGWRIGRGHALVSFIVYVGAWLLFLPLAAFVMWVGFFSHFEGDAFNFVLKYLIDKSTLTPVHVWLGVLLGFVSWLQLIVPATIASFYKSVLESNAKELWFDDPLEVRTCGEGPLKQGLRLVLDFDTAKLKAFCKVGLFYGVLPVLCLGLFAWYQLVFVPAQGGQVLLKMGSFLGEDELTLAELISFPFMCFPFLLIYGAKTALDSKAQHSFWRGVTPKLFFQCLPATFLSAALFLILGILMSFKTYTHLSIVFLLSFYVLPYLCFVVLRVVQGVHVSWWKSLQDFHGIFKQNPMVCFWSVFLVFFLGFCVSVVFLFSLNALKEVFPFWGVGQVSSTVDALSGERVLTLDMLPSLPFACAFIATVESCLEWGILLIMGCVAYMSKRADDQKKQDITVN